MWVRVVIGARRLNFLTTHLGLGIEERKLQMQALVGSEWLGAVPPDEDVLLCGDFNATPGSVPYRLAAQHLRDAQIGLKGHVPLRTFSSTKPFARIDHIFVSAGFVPGKIIVPRDRIARLASDHFPLVVDFAVGPAAAETPVRKSA
ncbi:MAG: endonuclease/exonuclease/phosphatase family protein [Lacunisphaera sp.]